MIVSWYNRVASRLVKLPDSLWNFLSLLNLTLLGFLIGFDDWFFYVLLLTDVFGMIAQYMQRRRERSEEGI